MSNQIAKKMKRKSLQCKLREIAKLGTLRTHSLDEALTFCKTGYVDDPAFCEEQITKTKDAYSRGLILCSFVAYENADVEMLQVHQLTTSLADFVINVVYFAVSKK